MSSKPGFWRRCRFAFRCARFTVWGALILLLAALGWFNSVGLPGFLKTRLVAALRDRGVELEFSRMRLRFVHGLVCENVRVGTAQGVAEPVLSAREVQLQISYPALLCLHLEVDGLVLRGGKLSVATAPGESLTLTNLQGRLRILPEDTWSLDEFTGDLAGAKFKLAGEVAHASECRYWTGFAAAQPAARGGVESSLQQFADTLKEIHFEGKPQISARLTGDVRNLHSFMFRLSGRAAGIATPWGSARNLEFAVRAIVPTNAPSHANPTWDFWTNPRSVQIDWLARSAELKAAGLEAEDLDCAGTWNPPELAGNQSLKTVGLLWRDGRLSLAVAPGDSLALTHLHGQLRILPDDTWSLDEFSGNFAGIHFKLTGEVAHASEGGNWKMSAAPKIPGRSDASSLLRQFSDGLKQIRFTGQPQISARLTGDARHIHSFAGQLSGDAPGIETPWGSARNLEFAVHAAALTNASPYAHPAWDFWTNLQPFQIDWLVRSAELKAAGLEAGKLDCAGAWSAPELAVNQCSLELGHGPFNATAKLDVATRELAFSVNSAFDFHAVESLLPESARSGLGQVAWGAPPQLRLSGSWTVPAWTNRGAGWVDLAANLRLRGDLALTNLLVAGRVPVDSARTRFSYADRDWTLADSKLARGRTVLELSGRESEATRDFHCHIGGRLDADVVRPFLTTSNAIQGFGQLHFRQPLTLTLEVAGNLRDFSTLSATGRVAATDFAVREQWIDSLAAALSYTNLTADFYHPQLVRADGAEKFGAEKVTLDLAGQKLWLHGGRGHVLPTAVAAAIGPQTAAAMEPYHFLALPDATVEGCIPLKFQDGDLITDDADLQFNVIGTVPFGWRRFQTPAITGSIHWLGNNLILTNVTAACYGGAAQGWGVFDVQTPGEGTDFYFYLEGTNVDFNAMGKALWSPTNQLRGGLSGQLTVTSANSSDWRTWNGYGQAKLQNGLLWDAPVFGLMSPVLNGITPGLDMGNSRATEGAGSFTMTNGVIFTDSLKIQSLTMRFDYVGTVDLRENVDARVKVQLLRNTPVFGSLFSTLLSPVSKAFECDVTGTLDQPRIRPAYIPFSQYLAAPLHPIRTVEKIFSPPATNSPAKP